MRGYNFLVESYQNTLKFGICRFSACISTLQRDSAKNMPEILKSTST